MENEQPEGQRTKAHLIDRRNSPRHGECRVLSPAKGLDLGFGDAAIELLGACRRYFVLYFSVTLLCLRAAILLVSSRTSLDRTIN